MKIMLRALTFLVAAAIAATDSTDNGCLPSIQTARPPVPAHAAAAHTAAADAAPLVSVVAPSLTIGSTPIQ